MFSDEVRLTLQLVAATVVLLVGLGLIISGFIVPPLGVIDSSVLVAFGEALSFVGTILGIDYRYKYKYLTSINRK